MAQTTSTPLATSTITIGKDGAVLRDGKPFRGIGVNYFNAFARALENPGDVSYREGFSELSRRGIPFVRFMACGFWPINMKLYQEDKEAYFKLMDDVIKTAEEKNVGLIPSLFWNFSTFPDLMNEPCAQWANPESKTSAFMRQYVSDVVERYKNSPAIWAWEFGNEYSLCADLPDPANHRPPITPQLGSPTTRSEADDMTHDLIVTACAQFATEVRKHDPLRPITTGNSLPRPAAAHLRAERSWTNDSREEFTKDLAEVTPNPSNLISVHVYPADEIKRFGQEHVSYEEILLLCMQTAAKEGKALFVGEFGASDEDAEGNAETVMKNNKEMLEALEKTRVPLSALWVFDFSYHDSSINVTASNKRAYMLDELEKANQRMREAQ
jgi:hypothetical protein